MWSYLDRDTRPLAYFETTLSASWFERPTPRHPGYGNYRGSKNKAFGLPCLTPDDVLETDAYCRFCKPQLMSWTPSLLVDIATLPNFLTRQRLQARYRFLTSHLGLRWFQALIQYSRQVDSEV